MDNLYIALTIVLVFVAIAIIALVLLQKGKGADAGAAFGSGASGTVFGARGSTNFLSRATAVMAVAFFATCLGLAYLSTQRSSPDSLLDQVEDSAATATEPSLIPAEGSDSVVADDLIAVPNDSEQDIPEIDIPEAAGDVLAPAEQLQESADEEPGQG